MKVLVTGASGLLGRAVASTFTSSGHDVVGLSFTRSGPNLRQVDLRDEAALSSVLKEVSPDVVVHCAAERRPDVVEGAPEEAHAINVQVPATLARLCSELRADASESEGPPLLLNISTDYVFDGVTPPHRVEDAPNPLNAYGMSKWDGEKAVSQYGAEGRAASLRVPVLYGRAEKPSESAVNVLLTAIEPPVPGAPPRKMDASAVRYPTSVDDVARCLLQVATIWSSSEGGKPVPSLLHFSAREPMTKHDMCNVLARIQRSVGEEAGTEHLEPVFEPDAIEATKRPRHVKLDMAVTQEFGVDTTCKGFEDWWTPYLEELAVIAREERKRKAEEEEKKREEEEEQRRKEEEERRRREEEEAKKRAEEEAERKRIEEEERKKREEEERQRREEEEAERRRREAEEEEQRKKAAEEEEAQRKEADKAAAEDVKKEELATEDAAAPLVGDTDAAPSPLGQAGAAATAATAVDAAGSSTVAPSSATSASSVRAISPTGVASPSSPHLSFSSLQARPTPPATSGMPSPTSSIPPQPTDSADAEHREPSPDEETVGSSSHIRTADGEESAAPVDPLAAAAAAAVTSANARATQSTSARFLEEPGFFPAALTSSGDGFSAPGHHPGAPGGAAHAGAGDADSDGYGQPSPRASTAPTQFEAGYGEVPFGLDDADGTGRDGQPGSAAPTSEAMSRDASTSAQGREAGAAGAVGNKADGKPPRPWFIIKVGDPQKVGDPVTAHIVYTVRTRTNSPNFKGESISVLRRYSDFRWLHAALVHNKPGVFIPPVPEKVKMGRFAPDLVEARRHGLENCINKIANHALLQDDEDLKLFLESDRFAADVKARDARKGPVPTPEQKTYFGWSTSIGAPKFHEFDEWFEQQKAYLDSLEVQLKQLVRSVSGVAQLRKDCAGQTAELSQALLMLSGSSLSRSLSTCFAGLGEVERRTCELGDLQADADIRDLGSVVYEYERIVGSIRKAFMARTDVWLAWQRADDEARKVRAKHEKLKRESRVSSSDRLHDSLQDVAESEGRALALKQDFDLVGARCKEEMARFDHEKVEDLRKAIGDWLQGLIERQTELVGEWRQYAALIERQTKLPVRGKPTS